MGRLCTPRRRGSLQQQAKHAEKTERKGASTGRRQHREALAADKPTYLHMDSAMPGFQSSLQERDHNRRVLRGLNILHAPTHGACTPPPMDAPPQAEELDHEDHWREGEEGEKQSQPQCPVEGPDETPAVARLAVGCHQDAQRRLEVGILSRGAAGRAGQSVVAF